MARENEEEIDQEDQAEPNIEDAADTGVNLEDDDAAAGAGDDKKTPIPEDQKHLFPSKFKYYEDVAAWGAEAEKAKGRAETERDQIRTDAEAREEDARGAAGPSEEDKRAAHEQFQNDWAEDPMGTMQRALDERDARRDGNNAQNAQQNLWVQEDDYYADQYGEREWEDTVRPALARIAQERPHLRTLEDAIAVYEYGRSQGAATDRQEHDEKQRQKGAAFSESAGAGARRPGEKSVVAKIGAAASMEALDKMRDAAQS